MSGEGEFDYIRRRLAPLSMSAPGAAGLTDDGAVITAPPGHELAITADTLIEGRHFPVGEDPALAARKALRVNLSDLAAMGADPLAYLSCVVWPEDGREARAEAFADGLALDQSEFNIPLIGGDTTRAPGPWVIAITALGAVPTGRTVRRSGAQIGDVIVVTGTIGDAGLGLKWRQGDLKAPGEDAAFFNQRLTLPQPRHGVADLVREYAHAAIDVSDGLLADLRHVCAASGLGAELALDQIPLSEPAKRWCLTRSERGEALLELAAAGDDYELLLTLPPHQLTAFQQAAQARGVPVTQIGVMAAAEAGIDIRYENQLVRPARWGFTHF